MSTYKIVLLGEGRVGKTCLCLRYVNNKFSSDQQSTLEATYLEKRLNLGNKSVKLNIWDTAGQERYHALGPIYYRDANGALLVYDITDRDSFTKVRNWVKELRKIIGNKIVLVIAGNKCDLEKYRQVEESEATEYAQSVGAIHIQCSAKTGVNVEQAFLEITKGMMNPNPTVGAGSGNVGGTQNNSNNGNDDSNPRAKIHFVEEGQTNGGCC
jgi:Ras-related protein Rab-21